MRETLLDILEGIGIIVWNPENDFDLSELFVDSIQFISFITEVEDYLNMTIPDQYLLIDNFRSFNALCDAWDNIRNNE